MAVTQSILSLDKYFKETSGDKIIVNDLSFFSSKDIEMINNNLITIYENTETLSTKASCDCGKLEGRYRLGKICRSCGTKCKEPHEKVEPLFWLKALDQNYLFLNPAMWLMISRLLGSRQDWLRYLCDYRYNPPVEVPAHVINIRNTILNNVRDYSLVMQNIENIIIYLSQLAKYKTVDKQQELKLILDLFTNHKYELFTNYVPIVNKKLFVMENTTKGRFVNLAASDVVDVVMTWLKACSDEGLNQKQLSSTMGNVLSNLSNLYKTYFEKFIVKKSGMFRKHVYGARSHFTFRNVITSVPGPHAHDEVIPPWPVMVTCFRPHLLNKLIKRGFTYKKANKLLFLSVKKFDPLIDELLEELIKECPYKGLPIITQRNPSLKQSSALLTFVKKYNKNPEIKVFAVSSLIIKFPNGKIPSYA